MTTRPLIFLTAFACIALAQTGCRGKKTNPATDAGSSDGGSAAINAKPAGPWTPAIVAQSTDSSLRLVRMNDGGLIVQSSIFLYAINAPITPKGDAVLTRIGAPADYVPLLPEGDEELTGYDARAYSNNNEALSGTVARPFVRRGMYNVLEEAIFAWDGKAFTKVTDAPAPERDVSDVYGGRRSRGSDLQAAGGGKDAGASAASQPAIDGLSQLYNWSLPEAVPSRLSALSDAGAPEAGVGAGVAAAAQRFVWIGRRESDQRPEREEPDETIIVTRGNYRAAHMIPIPDDGAPPKPDPEPNTWTRARHCTFPLNANTEEIYLACTTHNNLHQSMLRMYRLEVDAKTGVERWVSALPTADAFKRENGMADSHYPVIDAEGGFWSIEGSPAALVHRSKKGDDENRFELPTPVDPTPPSFRTDSVATLKKTVALANTAGAPAGEGDDDHAGYRNWTTLSVSEGSPPNAPNHIRSVVPTKSGDVWVIAGHYSSGSILIRYSRSTMAASHKGDAGVDAAAAVAATPAPTPAKRSIPLIGSAADQQNDIRNARGVRRWVGHCTSLFVPFPASETGDKAQADKYYEAHHQSFADAIKKVQAKDKKKTGFADVKVVEGMLGDRRVMGMMFVRGYPEQSEESMEAAASRIAEMVTTNPASQPDITCSVPTLERVLGTVQAGSVENAVYE